MLSLKQISIRAAVWTIIGYGVSQVLRLGSNLILTRLLVPELFGLMTLVSIFITGLQLFSEIGIGTSIIQNKNGDQPSFLNTAWTLQVIRGFILWLFCLLIAWPISYFYQDSQLLWLIPAVGLNTVISGFNSIAIFTLGRDMALGKLTAIELTSQLISVIVIITWASISPSVWSFVVGGWATVVTYLLLSYLLIPKSFNCFFWDEKAVRQILSFGKWIALSTSLAFLATQVDRILLGRLLSLKMLGIYSIAATFSEIPRQVSGTIGYRVLFPTVSKLVELPRSEFQGRLLKNRKHVLLIALVGVSLLISFGDLLIHFFYDYRYAPAAWMLPILAVGIWPNVLYQTAGIALLAFGEPKYESKGNLIKFLFTAIGIPLGSLSFGILGIIIVIALNDLPLYGVSVIGLYKRGVQSLPQDFQMTFLLLIATILLISLRFVVGFGTPFDTLYLLHLNQT